MLDCIYITRWYTVPTISWKYYSPPKLWQVLISRRRVTSKKTLIFIINTALIACSLSRRHFFFICVRWLMNTTNKNACHKFILSARESENCGFILRNMLFLLLTCYYCGKRFRSCILYKSILGILRMHIRVSVGYDFTAENMRIEGNIVRDFFLENIGTHILSTCHFQSGKKNQLFNIVSGWRYDDARRSGNLEYVRSQVLRLQCSLSCALQ